MGIIDDRLGAKVSVSLPDVPFLTLYTIDFHARQLLRQHEPDALRRPGPVDVRWFWEHGIEMLGGDADVGSVELMGEFEAWTDWHGDHPTILLREDRYDAMLEGSEGALRTFATIAHEIGHLVLHRGVRQRMKLVTDDERLFRGSAEWQAWAFAGCLLMPTPTVNSLQIINPVEVGRVFQISPQLALRHLKRLRDADMLTGELPT